MARLRFTILGCGSSGGVPRIGGHWGDCDPANPKNRRRRCSLLVEREVETGTTRVLIDTSPDMRDQLLDAGVGTLDAVLFTHSHADHTHGIDDLRQVVFNTRQRLAGLGRRANAGGAALAVRLCLRPARGQPLSADPRPAPIDGPVTIDGAGGAITFQPFYADHGTIDALGFRIGPLAYLPDAVAIPEESWPLLDGLDCFVVDALRRKPHPTHAHLALALEWIARARPARAILTNMHIDLDFATLEVELPPHIRPAFDGMTVSYDTPS
jgi:phosphoribosyl 1,2-cyclic phosphate phosphodiesterase